MKKHRTISPLFKKLIQIVLGLAITLLTSKIATADPIVNQVVKEAIKETGNVIIDIVTTANVDSIKPDTTAFPYN